jgi:hypothetical protein
MAATLKANLFLLAVGLAFVVLILAHTADDDSEGKPVADPPTERAASSETAPAEAAQAKPVKPRATASKAKVTPSPATKPNRRDADDLLNELNTLAWDEDTIDGEEASDLLRRLRLQGADALIPIRDFLLNARRSGQVPSELRQALLEVLLGLESPEVESVALQLLANGPDAFEVLELGLFLEGVQPGKYSQAVLLAAEHALIEADSTTMLPAGFFQFLGELGNEGTVLLLAEMPWHHQAYASIALASIPDGSGISTLAQNAFAIASNRNSMHGRVAIQLLAQMGPQFSEAAASLIRLAEQGAIPLDVWPHVLDIVAGNWELTLLEPMPDDLVWSHTFFHQVGNQVIYGATRHQDATDNDLDAQRLYLLDQLMPLVPPGLPTDG